MSIFYKFKVEDFASKKCLFLEDINNGDIQLEENIIDVLSEIADQSEEFSSIPAKDAVIVFKNSDGLWNGYDPRKGEYIELLCDNPYHAVRRYLKQQSTGSLIYYKPKTKEVNMRGPKEGGDDDDE